ncbi:hypothetical protein [Acinetobacter indicus]|uniref:hypothetical protein n=1 Tax=Acinetobacter indicus TaxID=756892 RepID=UPI00209A6D66|nr:hypothetical protein [Acinetobacter indicus]MCO8088219.1 hypothetical protein [Acinetobacter indicus]
MNHRMITPSKTYKTAGDLVADKEIALEVLAKIPVDSNYMRMNKDHGMFYKYDKEGNKTKFRVPHRYLRYLGGWHPLDLAMSWDKFSEMNHIFDVDEFKRLMIKRYPIETVGEQKVWEIIAADNHGARYYNALADSFHKPGPNGYSLFMRIDQYNIPGQWLESAHRNDDLEKLFINIRGLKLMVHQSYDFNFMA